MNHELHIPELNKTYYMPSELSECSGMQYIEVCALLFDYLQGNLYYEELRVQMVCRLLGFKPKEEKNQDDQEDKDANIYLISTYLDSFFDDETTGEGVAAETKKVLRLNLEEDPIQQFTPINKTYVGPGGFSNMTYGEFLDALRLFHEFHVSGEIDVLHELAAILYRPSKNGEQLPYNSTSVAKRAKIFKKTTIGFSYGVYLYFASFNSFLTTAVIPWGSVDIDFSILFDEVKEESMYPGIGMDSVAFALAESNTFGDFEGVRKTNFWVIMARLYDLRVKELREEQKNKNK
ncbi:hypothetical protein SAMN05216480_10547 [Pustulibacterium marinum]|uniref:Uncharacterized protein n=1 Tax=Pustulibacterium marinum TaxID=1224947 RepID=A0A1I7GL32_9FLAO|nr:hypothetical protein [Pustulibacterium marinum]SFU49138.1 hypothetical protein SAMN05216480_10547 [Pustulibacterium marinum]